MEDLMPLTHYHDLIATVAKRRDALDPDLVEAMVLVESAGHTDAFRFEPAYFDRYLRPIVETDPTYRGLTARRCGSSYGLLQVMFPTAVQYHYTGVPEGLFVPEIGLEYACRYLADLFRWAKGDDRGPHRWQAVAAYNTGKGNWTSAAGQAYVQKVQGALARVHGTALATGSLDGKKA